MSTNPNDRAFPVYDEAERGLTKREWMAGQVAAGFLDGWGTSQEQLTTAATYVVRLTDAILAELDRPKAEQPRHAES